MFLSHRKVGFFTFFLVFKASNKKKKQMKFQASFFILVWLAIYSCRIECERLNIKLAGLQQQFNILYNLKTPGDGGCDLIKSSNVPKSMKCLILCQITECKSIKFDSTHNKCTIYSSRPNLIQYEKLENMSVIYVLGK